MHRRNFLFAAVAAMVVFVARLPTAAAWTGYPHPPGKNRPCTARFCAWYTTCSTGESRCTHRAFGGKG